MFGAVDSIVAYMDGNKGSFLSGYRHVRSHDAADRTCGQSHLRPIPLTADPAYSRSRLRRSHLQPIPLTADPTYRRSHLPPIPLAADPTYGRSRLRPIPLIGVARLRPSAFIACAVPTAASARCHASRGAAHRAACWWRASRSTCITSRTSSRSRPPRATQWYGCSFQPRCDPPAHIGAASRLNPATSAP